MHDPLGAYVPDGALDRQDSAVGSLAGLSFAVKDLFAVKGAAASCGNPDWMRTHPSATVDAAAVRACLNAGARLLGRTVMDELAYSLSGRNPHHGTPTNPNAPGRLAGGSSCGSAAAVAGGLVDFALGTDTGGSVRVPASYCGLFGLRPTHGAVSLQGAMALAPSFDTAGWFAREAEILKAVGEVLLPDPPPGLPEQPAGLLVAEDAWALAAPAAQAALMPALERLRPRFPESGEVTLADAPGGLAEWMDAFRSIQAREAHAQFADWVARETPTFGPEMAERWDFARGVGAAQAARATEKRERCRARLEYLTADGWIVCLPGAPDAAPMLDAAPETLRAHRDRLLRLTSPAGLAGLPQIALPLARVAGVPIALGLIGPRGGERMLLDLAMAICGDERRDPGARFD